MSERFYEATRVERLADGHFEGQFPEGWGQGPFLFGGVVVGAMLRAVIEADGKQRPVRVLSAMLPAPAKVGPYRVEVVRLREGASVAVWRASLIQGGGICAEVQVCLGRDRATDLDEAGWGPPRMAPREAVPEVPLGLPYVPEFTKHMRFWYAAGAPPLTGAAEGFSAGYVCMREPEPVDAPLLVGYADAWPPALFMRASAPRPMGSLSMTLAFGSEPPGAAGADEVFLISTRSAHTQGGYSMQDDGVWDARGRLMVRSSQVVAVVR